MNNQSAAEGKSDNTEIKDVQYFREPKMNLKIDMPYGTGAMDAP